jgi:hypothetical protein
MDKLPGCGTCGMWNRRNGAKHGTCEMDGSKTAYFDRCAFHQRQMRSESDGCSVAPREPLNRTFG